MTQLILNKRVQVEFIFRFNMSSDWREKGTFTEYAVLPEFSIFTDTKEKYIGISLVFMVFQIRIYFT